MTRNSAYTQFHRWLESRTWHREEDYPFSIGIEGSDEDICTELGLEVAAYLSTADAHAPGGWLYFGEELVSKVATKTGIAELTNAFPDISTRDYSPCSERRCGFLSDVARLGGAVLYLPSACRSLRDAPDLFVAGIQNRSLHHGDPSDFVHGDITVDLGRIGNETAVRVIADSALEWALARHTAAGTHPSNVTPWKSSC